MALPINVGLMFFNESPDDFFPYAQIEVVIKPDTIRTIVKELLENGEAEYSYPEKTNNPNQKIRLK
ncbi:hypothetical protein [Oribacterium sp. NK2B42]|uniref:hypothetical protein n=1 Tax=Oribacterium sp. NK2B42 TaxID=689781 RepID=UPI0004279731|nr:hypothetical protein [Oribacterium sp. NK2B42]